MYHKRPQDLQNNTNLIKNNHWHVILLLNTVPQAGERVNLRLEQGSTMSNQYVLTSFSGFKYEPANLPRDERVVWFVTMNNDLDVSVLDEFYEPNQRNVVNERQIINCFVKDI